MTRIEAIFQRNEARKLQRWSSGPRSMKRRKEYVRKRVKMDNPFDRAGSIRLDEEETLLKLEKVSHLPRLWPSRSGQNGLGPEKSDEPFAIFRGRSDTSDRRD